MISIFCDGGARGNPGPAAYGFVIKEDEEIKKEEGGYIGIATNNQAEYTAIEKALTFAQTKYPGKDLSFFLDSQLAVSQLSGLYKIKNAKIREMVFKIRELEASFGQITYTHIPRELNHQADRQVNKALDEHLK